MNGPGRNKPAHGDLGALRAHDLDRRPPWRNAPLRRGRGRRRRRHRPGRIRPEFDSGDGLHVNDAGAQAIADAVDLSLLRL
ncbi:hypothetical protein ADL04_14180 [Streptomyces sp. NRRL B-3648]|nr:hypothetical protein ADL04_14180 [Streptomyces sp. NRRL B-3648]